eukprot:COSAG05_NODE_6198_length_1001_cov_1.375831_1_plen_72_part_00
MLISPGVYAYGRYFQDRIDRRAWLFIGSPGMAVSLVILALAFQLQGGIVSVLAVLCLMAYHPLPARPDTSR